jgi:putative transposase
MARPPRLEVLGGVYHVVVRGNERAAVFRDDSDRERYLQRLEHYRQKFDLRVLAFCLMGNHVHLAIRRGQCPLSRAMAGLQSSYTQWFNRRHRRVGHLFQGRYKAFLVQEDVYLLGLVRYIHENPVKARMVETAREYPWSSDRYYRRGRGPAWLDLDDVLKMLGRRRREAVKAYVALMARGDAPDYEKAESVGQLVKGEEGFALVQLEESRQLEPRLRGLSERKVVEAVARALDLEVSEVRGRHKNHRLAEARWIAGYLGRQLGAISLARMGRYFHRDESTLVKGVACFEEKLKEDRPARGRLSAIVRQIRSTRKATFSGLTP